MNFLSFEDDKEYHKNFMTSDKYKQLGKDVEKS